MKTWFAEYYSSHGADPAKASVLASANELSFTWRTDDGLIKREQWNISDLTVKDSINEGSVITTASAPQARLVIKGKEAALFINDSKEEKLKPWYKQVKNKYALRNAGIFLGVAGVLVLAYFLLVPWFSEKLASRVSIHTEQQFGDAAYEGLGIATQQDVRATAIINSFFDEMHIATPYTIRISVVKDNTVNAFALPGGRIVVYTALLDKLHSYPELAALLCHEFIHVNNRHSTKSIFRKLGSKVFISLLFGNAGNVASVLADRADDFKSLTYSRSLEKEADLEGLQLLEERKIDPAGFDLLFKELKRSARASAMPEFLESHPDIDKRIAYIHEEAKGKDIQENETLKAIFNQLKNK